MSTATPSTSDPIAPPVPDSPTEAEFTIATAVSEPLPPQVHPALKNFDILSKIFEQFDGGFDSDERRESRKHLYWAALTNKDFLDPALDYIWRSIDRLLPLLKLLPTLEAVNQIHVSRV